MKEIAYQGRRKPFEGTSYDLKKLATYEPANLGLFFTQSQEVATRFGKFVDKAEIEIGNLAQMDGSNDNLRKLIPAIKKAKKKYSGVRVTNVLDGTLHKVLYIIWKPEVVRRIGQINEDTEGGEPAATTTTQAIQTFDPILGVVSKKKKPQPSYREFDVDEAVFNKFNRGRVKFERWSRFLDMNDDTQRAIYEYARSSGRGTIILRNSANGALRAIRRRAANE